MKEFFWFVGGLLSAIVAAVCILAVVGYGTWIALDHVLGDFGCVSKGTRHVWVRDYSHTDAFYCSKCMTVKLLSPDKTAEVETKATLEVKVK